MNRTSKATIAELLAIAVNAVGGCVAVSWRTLVGERPFCLAHVLFRSPGEARLFLAELRRRGLAHLPARHVRELTVWDEQGWLRGHAAVAIASPEPELPEWVQAAPTPISAQPGLAQRARLREQRMERELAREARERPEPSEPTGRLATAWELLAGDDDGRPGLVAEPELSPGALADLARIEAEVGHQFRSDPRYFASVEELLAAVNRRAARSWGRAARQGGEPRGREATAATWLSEARQAEAARRRQLEADRAEVAAALRTPRRDRADQPQPARLQDE